MMLDEFPALGRLDFFESALAFMAGYGLKSFLIAQSLNQIENAYGQIDPRQLSCPRELCDGKVKFLASQTVESTRDGGIEHLRKTRIATRRRLQPQTCVTLSDGRYTVARLFIQGDKDHLTF